MKMEKFTTWALAVSAVLILGSSYLLDGPSEAEIAQRTALDLQDARNQAARDVGEVRREHRDLDLQDRVARGETANHVAGAR